MLIFATLGVLVLCVSAYQYRSDLNLISEALERLRDQIANGGERNRSQYVVRHPTTFVGRKAFTSFSFLRTRVAENSWGELQRAEDQNLLPIPEIRAQDPRTLNQDDFYSELCFSITQKFRSKIVAIAIAEEEHGLKVFAEGVSAERIAPHLKHMYEGYFIREEVDRLGRRDSLESREVLADPGALGCRYSLALPFTPRQGSKGLLWLGYQSSPPTDYEVRWAQTLAAKIGSEVRTRDQLVAIYDEIRRDERVDHQYIATVSHDIRTPLNTLRNALALAKLEGGSISQPSLCEVLLEQCDHMGDMVEDLTDYSRHQIGKLSAMPENIHVNELLESVVRSFEGQAAAKRIRLIHEADECGVVRFDRKHLRRILANIIDNAIKYTAPNGIVRVRSKLLGGESSSCGISIIDNGKGFAADELNKAFEPFQRFDTENEGTGLGLAISKALAELNASNLEIHSASGRGTELHLSIPLTSETCKEPQERYEPKQLVCGQLEPRSTVSPSSESHQSESERCAEVGPSTPAPIPFPTFRKVLVVDDDKDTVELLTGTLTKSGFTALGAHTVPEAIGMLQLGEPHVVITDGSMPGGGGRQLLRAIRSNRLEIPVAVISGRDDREEREQLKKAGASKFFLKPVPFEDVLKWIDAVVPK